MILTVSSAKNAEIREENQEKTLHLSALFALNQSVSIREIRV